MIRAVVALQSTVWWMRGSISEFGTWKRQILAALGVSALRLDD
jgi:hypothetical protein